MLLCLRREAPQHAAAVVHFHTNSFLAYSSSGTEDGEEESVVGVFFFLFFFKRLGDKI